MFAKETFQTVNDSGWSFNTIYLQSLSKMSFDGYFSRSMSLILKCVINLYKDKVIIAAEKE